VAIQKTIFVVAVDTRDIEGEKKCAGGIDVLLERLRSRWHRSIHLDIAPTNLGVVELEFSGDSRQYVNTACVSTTRLLEEQGLQVLVHKPTERVPTTGEVVFRDKGLAGTANLTPQVEAIETATYEVSLTGTPGQIDALKAALAVLVQKTGARVTRI
jgi:hypothetical protein